MDNFAQLGIEYAQSLPLALASVVVPVAFLAWLAAHVEKMPGELHSAMYTCLAVAACFFVVQWPFAYNQAKKGCRAIQSQGMIDYISSGCYTVWPEGPDGHRPVLIQ